VRNEEVLIIQDFGNCAIFSNRHKKGGTIIVDVTKTLNFLNVQKKVNTSKYNVTVSKCGTVLLMF